MSARSARRPPRSSGRGCPAANLPERCALGSYARLRTRYLFDAVWAGSATDVTCWSPETGPPLLPRLGLSLDERDLVASGASALIRISGAPARHQVARDPAADGEAVPTAPASGCHESCSSERVPSRHRGCL